MGVIGIWFALQLYDPKKCQQVQQWNIDQQLICCQVSSTVSVNTGGTTPDGLTPDCSPATVNSSTPDNTVQTDSPPPVCNCLVQPTSRPLRVTTSVRWHSPLLAAHERGCLRFWRIGQSDFTRGQLVFLLCKPNNLSRSDSSSRFTLISHCVLHAANCGRCWLFLLGLFWSILDLATPPT